VRGIVTFSLQPAAPGYDFEQLDLDNVELGQQRLIVELDKRRVGGYVIAFAHQNPGDHATLRVLDHLPGACLLYSTCGDDGAGYICQRRPTAKTGAEQN